MKISVLTPAFNSARTIAQCVRSFLEQDWQDKEMIILDAGSVDGTQDVVLSLKDDRIRLVSEPDKGMYDGLNKGLALYTGDAVGVLNSDDAYAGPDTLSRIVNALDTADMVHASLVFRNGQGDTVRTWSAEERPKGGFRSGWMPAHPTFYVRRKVAETVGPFDLSYSTASDYDWMLRAIEVHRFSLATLNEVLVNMAIGGRSTKSLLSYAGHNLEALSARRRWLGSGIVDYALIAKPGRKLKQFAGGSPQRITRRQDL